jgi:type VI secretion system VasD/TssJ family lipoprotein
MRLLTRTLTLVLVMAAMCAACAKKPPAPAPPPVKPPEPPVTIAAPPPAPGAPVKAKAALTISTAADTNPDASGRGTSVVVRVYQLKSNAAFNGADFFPLYDDDKKLLGPEMITRDEFVLSPSERRTIDVVFSDETRFIGVVAAFRDIRNAQWRTVMPVPQGGLNVSVERVRVVTSAIN